MNSQKSRPVLPLSGRPARRDLADFVDDLPTPPQLLGLTHVTTGYTLREVLDEGQLACPGKCPVLNEPLIYTFYGRAAFRQAEDHTPSDLAFQFPAVLVLDPSKLPAPKYVFGFDSGAFVGNYMDDYLDRYMPLFDFQLTPTVASAAKVANGFFESSENFLDNVPATGPTVPQGNFEAVSYDRMLRSGGRGSNRLDDRVSTPEIIFDQAIELGAAVVAVILPAPLAGDLGIGGRMKAHGIRVEAYEWTGVTRPSEYHMVIRRHIKLIYQELGWL